jgi:hypothetical protein
MLFQRQTPQVEGLVALSDDLGLLTIYHECLAVPQSDVGHVVLAEQRRTSSWNVWRSVPVGVRDQSGFR